MNFDSALNFTDLNVMAANYYTVVGQTIETWATGDIVSIDPNYATTAVDANLVNATDLNLVALTWVQVLGQPKVTPRRPIARATPGNSAPTCSPPLLLSAAYQETTMRTARSMRRTTLSGVIPKAPRVPASPPMAMAIMWSTWRIITGGPHGSATPWHPLMRLLLPPPFRNLPRWWACW